MEEAHFANLSVASESGSITDVRMVAKGGGYTKLPVVKCNICSGNGAKLLPISNAGIGAINSFEVYKSRFGIFHCTNI